jgi:trigger factor
MKVEVKSKKGLRTTLSVIIDKKTIQKKMDEKLNELQKEVSLKGFRPGKVPPAVIKNHRARGVLNNDVTRS